MANTARGNFRIEKERFYREHRGWEEGAARQMWGLEVPPRHRRGLSKPEKLRRLPRSAADLCWSQPSISVFKTRAD